jgi:hypothetical protein
MERVIAESPTFEEAAARLRISSVTLWRMRKRYGIDRAITPSLFHWESQSRTRADSPTGRRYRESASSDWQILLFVRQSATDERGFIAPYMFLGRVRYVHTNPRNRCALHGDSTIRCRRTFSPTSRSRRDSSTPWHRSPTSQKWFAPPDRERDTMGSCRAARVGPNGKNE